MLTLKAPITTTADDIHKCFSIVFPEKIRLDVSSESSVIHMKNQALFSSKDKSKKLKCRLLQYLFGLLRVKHPSNQYFSHVEIPVIAAMHCPHSVFDIGHCTVIHRDG